MPCATSCEPVCLHEGGFLDRSACCRSGADKISIGSDAVDVVEEVRRSGRLTGASSIEQISWHYGAQAVVISIDPRRVYVADPAQCSHQCVRTDIPGG